MNPRPQGQSVLHRAGRHTGGVKTVGERCWETRRQTTFSFHTREQTQNRLKTQIPCQVCRVAVPGGLWRRGGECGLYSILSPRGPPVRLSEKFTQEESKHLPRAPGCATAIPQEQQPRPSQRKGHRHALCPSPRPWRESPGKT